MLNRRSGAPPIRPALARSALPRSARRAGSSLGCRDRGERAGRPIQPVQPPGRRPHDGARRHRPRGPASARGAARSGAPPPHQPRCRRSALSSDRRLPSPLRGSGRRLRRERDVSAFVARLTSVLADHATPLDPRGPAGSACTGPAMGPVRRALSWWGWRRGPRLLSRRRATLPDRARAARPALLVAHQASQVFSRRDGPERVQCIASNARMADDEAHWVKERDPGGVAHDDASASERGRRRSEGTTTRIRLDRAAGRPPGSA